MAEWIKKDSYLDYMLYLVNYRSISNNDYEMNFI